MDPIYLNGPSASTPYEQIEIDDDEEDQLDSDLDDKPDGEQIEPDVEDALAEDDLMGPGQSASANGRRKSHRNSGERVPGQTLLPQTRLENILRADGESGPMSKEALFVLSVATEEFIKHLARSGHRQASASKRSTIAYRDMSAAASHQPELSFLEDVIPCPLAISLAFDRRVLKEKELIAEDPALTAPSVPSPFPDPHLPTITLPPSASTTTSQAPTPSSNSLSSAPQPMGTNRTKGKRASTNGRAKDNSSTPTTTPAPTMRERSERTRSAPAANGTTTVTMPNTTTVDPASPPQPERRRDPRPRDSRGRYSTTTADRRSSTASSGARHPPPEPQGWTATADNSLPPAEVLRWTGLEEPMPVRAHSHPHFHFQDPPWALAGPASAYMEERARSAGSGSGAGAVGEGPFGQTGRTIYSQR